MHHPAIEDHPAFVCRYEFAQKPYSVRHYNPALCRVDDALVMAWRVQDEQGISRIVASRLGRRYHVRDIVEIVIDAPRKSHIEDPRLIVADGKLLLFVAQVTYAATFVFIQRCFVLGEDLQPIEEIPLPYGKNGHGTHEKNWMPFQKTDGSLGLVYQVAPEHVVIDPAAGITHRTPGISRWRWGTVSGRTNAVRLSKSYIAFIGGHQPHPRRHSEYWVGAYQFAAEAPHEILGVSRDPILWASDRSPAILNPFDPGWNPICVFPAGLVLEGEHLLVSLGINDSYCALMRWRIDELLAQMVPLSEISGHEIRIAPSGAAAPVGNIRVRSRSRQPLGESGGPYALGDEWFTSRDRVEALGDKVEVLP